MLTRLTTGPATPTTDLVELLMDCHERIRRFSALAYRIATDPDATPEERSEACSAVERYFTEALPLHVQDEEESILPRLLGRSVTVDFALATMAEQHGSHEAALDKLLAACRAVRAAPSDEKAKAALESAASSLIEAFDEHLALEESVILPAIASQMSSDMRTKVVDELRSRRGKVSPARAM